MKKSNLKVVSRNKEVKKVMIADQVLDEEILKVIDRAENLDKSQFKEVTKQEIQDVINNFGEEEKEMYEVARRLMKVRKQLYKLVKNDLTFNPYAMLFDMLPLTEIVAKELECAMEKDLEPLDKVNLILEIIYEYKE